jgi:hypothetical protein
LPRIAPKSPIVSDLEIGGNVLTEIEILIETEIETETEIGKETLTEVEIGMMRIVRLFMLQPLKSRTLLMASLFLR